MKTLFFFCTVAFAAFGEQAPGNPQPTARLELNDGWRFSRAEELAQMREFSIPAILDMLDGMRRDLLEVPQASAVRQGYRPGENHPFLKPGFSDSKWEKCRVPHDAGIGFSFSHDLPPFDGYMPGSGVVWYRYHFTNCNSRISLPDGRILAAGRGMRLLFDCDGAMAFPLVWLNGRFVGGWPNGYMPFCLDLTDFLKPDGENVLAVRTYRPEDYARWHTGVGLTRRCWFVACAEDHLIRDSVAITTPEVSEREATVRVTYEMSKSGRREKTFTVANPRLWDVDDPYLYELELEGETFRYGIRTIEWTADDGFRLNGRRVQLKGFCYHQDLCSLGSVANRTAIRRRLEKGRQLGMNAVRMSHYPHARDWYELCDEMGILVMDELTDAWGLPKLFNDYHRLFPRWHERDLRAMIWRHRNHPSIVIWSLGNEIWESRTGSRNWPIYQKNGVEMNRIAHQEDATRPTTTANDNAEVWRSPLAQFQDVWGFNYRAKDYAEYHRLYPNRPVVGTETMCTQASRGEYQFHAEFRNPGEWGLPKPGRCYVDNRSNAYGFHTICAAEYEWAKQDENPYVAGGFSWTAFDYFGSPAVMVLRNRKPYLTDPVQQAQAEADVRRHGRARVGIHSCPTGVFDLAGQMKDEAFLYLARWRPEVPTVHILPHWNWDVTPSVERAPWSAKEGPVVLPNRIGRVTPVHVYSSGDEVELFVNGVSQGRKGRAKGLQRFCFDDVRYEPGEVRAVSYRKGVKWCEEAVRTTGPAARLDLVPERAEIVADGEDVGYVTVIVRDAAGDEVRNAKIPVEAEVLGAGEFYAMENGDETDFSWLMDRSRKTFNGRLSVLVKPREPGEIVVKVRSPGLPEATCRVRSAAPSISNPQPTTRRLAPSARCFIDERGKPFIPIGVNLCACRADAQLMGGRAEDRLLARRATYRRWMEEFAANGGNYIRIWLGADFFEVMPKTAGEYDPVATETLCRVVKDAERLGIRIKFTLESFRSTFPKDEMARQPFFNRALYAPYVKSMHEFFNSDECYQIYLGKAKYLKSLGLGESPAVVCWELWNEISATAPISSYAGWSDRMLADLQKLFPRQMVTQNLGSYSGPAGFLSYDQMATVDRNAFMQIHRYLDPGAQFDVCRGPMDVLCADSIREMFRRRADRPAVLAEVGAVRANHTGPSDLYAKDKQGMLLHDMLFAPFFAGSAGCGQAWHWDCYIDRNRLWHHFRRFARAIEGLDPIDERFRPFYTETDNLRIYGLRGRKTTVLWCRDKRNTWESELVRGEAPRTISGERLPFQKDYACYLPWKDETRECKGPVLPDFERSIVVRFPTGADWELFVEQH